MKKITRTLLILLALLLAGAAAFILCGMHFQWFDTYDTVTPPTCTEDGYTLHHSYFNREHIIEPTPALGHDYTVTVHAPTCTEAGISVYQCTRCDYSYEDDRTSPTGHTYDISVTVPTCTEIGYTQYDCLHCDHTYRDHEHPPAGHAYTFTVTLSTCTSSGFTEYTCQNCGHTYKDHETPPLAHKNQTVITPPTCTEVGYTLNICQRCAHAELSDQKPPKGHAYLSTVHAPTCTAPGHTSHFCPDCGDTYTSDPVPATGHTHIGVITAPTCIAQGYTTYTCRDCPDAYLADYTDPLGHDYVTSLTPATTAQEGGTLHDCIRCNDHYLSDAFTFSDVFHGAQGDGNGILLEGIDLSYHNGKVDFKALRNAGITFVILRVGTSRTMPDPKFEEYYAQARAAGLSIGAYFYTYATNTAEALADAKAAQKYLEGKQFEYPIFYDIEDKSLTSLSPMLLTDIALTFCDAMVDAGYYPGVYTNKTWLAKYLEVDRIRSVYDIWLASWIVTGENISDYSDDYAMWQYTATGKVNGVSTDVDRNGTYRDFKAIIKRYGYNNFTQ